MINPLLSHPILKHLPYRDLKNPTVESIHIFVKRRRRNLLIVGLFFIFAPVLYSNINRLLGYGLGIVEYGFMLLSITLSILTLAQFDKCKLSADEIKRLLELHNANMRA
jgi:hypothetical protein